MVSEDIVHGLQRDLKRARLTSEEWRMDSAAKQIVIVEQAHEIAELKEAPFGRVIAPFRNHRGALCGTCDGTDAHEHARVECSRCGRTGLRENWPFNCCLSALTPRSPPNE